MTRTLSGAIVGAGQVALHGHLPGWLGRDDVAIVAAADPRREARPALEAALASAAAAGGPSSRNAPPILWRDTIEDLLDACASAGIALDFVDVCSPPAAHAGAIRAALERGIHVLCEKPLVLDGASLSSLASLAASRGLVLAAVHNWRFAPPVVLATELVRAGAIGPVRRCRWEVVREKPAAATGPTAPAPNAVAGKTAPANWRMDPTISGGGILVDHGWHAVYVVAGWMSGRLTEVSATLETRRHREFPVEDTADVRLGFEGSRAEIFLTWAGQERRNRVVLEGENGTIRIDGRRVSVESATDSFGSFEREATESLADGSHHPTWFEGVAAELVDAIRSPASRPSRSLTESAVCVEALELARESSTAGGAVRILQRGRLAPPEVFA
jgi:predicted dehydrogenase